MKIFSVDNGMDLPTVLNVQQISAVTLSNEVVRKSKTNEDVYGFFMGVDIGNFHFDFEFNRKEQRDHTYRQLVHAMKRCNEKEDSNEVH